MRSLRREEKAPEGTTERSRDEQVFHLGKVPEAERDEQVFKRGRNDRRTRERVVTHVRAPVALASEQVFPLL